MSYPSTEDIQIDSIINGAELAIAKLKSEGERPIDVHSLPKIKPRGLKRKTCTYVDHDQKPNEEDNQIAAELAWSGSARRKPSDTEFNSHVKASMCRQSVTYEDIAPMPMARQNNQLLVQSKQKFASPRMPPNEMRYQRPYDVPQPIAKCTIPECLFDYVDPNVEVSEKQLMSEKDEKKKTRGGKKGKQKNEKKRLYWEQKKKHLAEQTERKLNQPPVVCRFYLFGNCRKGEECSFSHVGEVPKKSELCKFYLKGLCMKKSDCPYYHGDWPCKFFHKFNFCMNGDACKFSHLPLTDITRVLLEKIVQTDESKVTEASLTQGRPPSNVKLYKLHEIEVDPSVAARQTSYFDGSTTTDPRALRHALSDDKQCETTGWGLTITQHTRPIPFSVDDSCHVDLVQCVEVEVEPPIDVKVFDCGPSVISIELDEKRERSVNASDDGLPTSVITNVDVMGSDADTKPVATSIIIGARHIMHHNVNWMSSKSVVRLKSSATAGCSDTK